MLVLVVASLLMVSLELLLAQGFTPEEACVDALNNFNQEPAND